MGFLDEKYIFKQAYPNGINLDDSSDPVLAFHKGYSIDGNQALINATAVNALFPHYIIFYE